ncbi:hypothetical protein THRCLA_02336 [Thraustotheca clavata]|uniref:Uncharacterized protein n=1 Tax=Thraustotheca clavata TaxID=74557 RepID=A0A1W0A5S1_9STRA|nr:hypothetical protein THRCLA_02336 [Thraustotheca clavata]
MLTYYQDICSNLQSHQLASIVSYDIAKIIQFTDIALLRKQPHDVSLLKLLAWVLVQYYVGLVPFVPYNNRLQPLIYWQEMMAMALAQLSRAVVIRICEEFEDIRVPIVDFCTLYTTSTTDSFLQLQPIPIAIATGFSVDSSFKSENSPFFAAYTNTKNSTALEILIFFQFLGQ